MKNYLNFSNWLENKSNSATINYQEKLKTIEEAGNTQRKTPEGVMVRVNREIQQLSCPPIIINRLEHFGDLSHRSSRMHSLWNVNEKNRRWCNFLHPIMGSNSSYWSAKREIEDGFLSNIIYGKIFIKI